MCVVILIGINRNDRKFQLFDRAINFYKTFRDRKVCTGGTVMELMGGARTDGCKN